MRTFKALTVLLLSLTMTGCMTYLAIQDDSSQDRQNSRGVNGRQSHDGRQNLDIADAIVTDIAVIGLIAEPLLDQYKKATMQPIPPTNNIQPCIKSQTQICSSSTGCWCTETDSSERL